MSSLTQKRLKELFSFNGTNFIRKSVVGGQQVGSVAGFIGSFDIWNIIIDSEKYQLNNLITLYNTGCLPESVIPMHRLYTVYGYAGLTSGEFKYIGCTKSPIKRKARHQNKSVHRLDGRYPSCDFKYHIFKDELTKNEALIKEANLIKYYRQTLDNEMGGNIL